MGVGPSTKIGPVSEVFQEKDRRFEIGRLGEKIACRYLEKKGYRIIETNWRTRRGELDVIAIQERTLVIVEVRSTRGVRFGYGFQSVDHRKRMQVRRLAEQYIAVKGFDHYPLRLDVISVLLSRDPSPKLIELRHLEGVL